MVQLIQIPSARTADAAGKRAILAVGILVFMLCLLPGLKAFSQKPDKVQRATEAIKETYSNAEDDYITDGQRTVWVKSYKKWMPDDLVFMKKEAPEILKFLSQAIQHHRLDALEQLLPNYYRAHGGIEAFAADIQRATQ